MRGSRTILTSVIALLLGTHVLAAQSTRNDALDRALRDELKRSMEQLRLEELDRPYYIAYRVTDTRTLNAMARYGSLAVSNESRRRIFTVELRIGDYSFDNTGSFGIPSMMSRGSFEGTELPLDDDYAVMRRQIWLATDEAYKHAIEAIAAKRAARISQQRSDSLPDFVKMAPTNTLDEDVMHPVALAELQALVRDVSAVPELERLPSSFASAMLTETHERYLTSEGTTFSRARSLLSVDLNANAQASDGTAVGATNTVLSPTYDSSSQRGALLARMRSLALQVDSQRVAPVMDRYSGPVLFEGEAAAQLVASVLTPALLGTRRMGQGNSGDKLGTRVLPSWVSVSDDPTLAAYDGQPLLGRYKVDDEGVTGRATPVVVSGYLRTLLSTRTPVEGVDGSTGNARGFGAVPSSLIVRSDSGVSEAILRKRFLALVELRKLPFGIVVRELQGGAQSFMQLMMGGDLQALMTRESGLAAGYNAALIAAYRVYPDGHEERIRQGRLVSFSIDSFRDLMAASSTAIVYNSPASGGGMMGMLAMSGMAGTPAPSSFVVPSLLFDDVALSKQNVERTTLPLSGPPPGS
jgi:predicted Zn-dependent protease